MKYSEAIKMAVQQQLENNNLYIFGQDIKLWGGQGNILKGLNEKYPEYIFDTPISEAATAGIATGMAISGKHVMVEYAFFDFILNSLDQIINHSAKLNYLSNGKYNVPVVFYVTINSDRGYGATHSQSLENMLFKVPGLSVQYPSNSTDAYHMLTKALKLKSPSVFITHKLLLDDETEYEVINSESARIINEGDKLTIVSYGRSIKLIQQVLDEQRITNVELIDLRYLNPIDVDTIKNSVIKTKKLLTVEEGYGSIGSEVIVSLSDVVNQYNVKLFRLNSSFTPFGVSKSLEQKNIVNTKTIEASLKTIL